LDRDSNNGKIIFNNAITAEFDNIRNIALNPTLWMQVEKCQHNYLKYEESCLLAPGSNKYAGILKIKIAEVLSYKPQYLN
jgi:hypothetical protein